MQKQKCILPRPGETMKLWNDCELGLFFHYDIEVFTPEKDIKKELPPASVWDPEQLDTDQWLSVAKAAGAKYAVLTAKHCSGFCLWPTSAYDYHVGNSAVPTDIVGAFVKSCRKYGIFPGLYFSMGSEYLNRICTTEDGSVDTERRIRIVKTQLEELLSNYGPIFELWFDGGVKRPELGWPDVVEIVNRLQPEAVCFCGIPGMKNVIRWSGSEQGVSLEDTWSTSSFVDDPKSSRIGCSDYGTPDSPVWAPVECDIPPRDIHSAFWEGWMYDEKDAGKTYSPEFLFSRYLTSVGRNSNLLIGCTPDKNGLICDEIADSFRKFGTLAEERLGKPLKCECVMGKDGTVQLWFDQPVDVEYFDVLEDLSEGQKIRKWVLEARWPETWKGRDPESGWFPIAEGRAVGHRRIIPLYHMHTYALRFRVTESVGEPVLRSASAFGSEKRF